MNSKSLGLIVIIIALVLSFSFFFFFRSPSGNQGENRGTKAGNKVDFIAENLNGRLSEIEAKTDFVTDYSFPLFANGKVSFHVHAMHAGQFCPLHRHEESEEVDFIIQGKGKVRSVLAGSGMEEGKKEIREMPLEKNFLFSAPPGNAHEFLNLSNEPLACLVIQSPPFKGNLYTKEEDVEKSAEASVRDLTAQANAMMGAVPGMVAVADVRTLRNIESRLIRSAEPLTETMSRGYDLIIIFFGGDALLEILGKKIRLAPTYFLGIPAGTPFRLVPDRGSQDSYLLCFYLPAVP